MDKKLGGMGYCFGGKHHYIAIHQTEAGTQLLVLDDNFRGKEHQQDLSRMNDLFWQAVRELERDYNETYWSAST